MLEQSTHSPQLLVNHNTTTPVTVLNRPFLYPVFMILYSMSGGPYPFITTRHSRLSHLADYSRSRILHQHAEKKTENILLLFNASCNGQPFDGTLFFV